MQALPPGSEQKKNPSLPNFKAARSSGVSTVPSSSARPTKLNDGQPARIFLRPGNSSRQPARGQTQPARSRRIIIRALQVLPVIFVVVMIIALSTILCVILPSYLGESTSPSTAHSGEGSKKYGDIRSGEDDNGEECGPPPGPDCLVWDWNEQSKMVGHVVNYWCITTSSFVVFASMKCSKNKTWSVTKMNHMPCTCEVDWLPIAFYDEMTDWPAPHENATAFVFTQNLSFKRESNVPIGLQSQQFQGLPPASFWLQNATLCKSAILLSLAGR